MRLIHISLSLSLSLSLIHFTICISFLSTPRTNTRSVLGQAVIFGIAQGSIFYMYAAGFSLGAFIVISDESKVYHATYDDIFR